MKKAILFLMALIAISTPFVFAQSGINQPKFDVAHEDVPSHRRFYSSNNCYVIIQDGMITALAHNHLSDELDLREKITITSDGAISGNFYILNYSSVAETVEVPLGIKANGDLFVANCSMIANRDLPADVRKMFSGHLGVK